MADDTFASKKIGDIYAGGNPKKQWATCAEAIGPGDTMRLGSDGKIYATKESDGGVRGIMALKDGHDLDTDYAVDEWAPYYVVGQDTNAWAKLKARNPAIATDNYHAVLSTTDDTIDVFDSTRYVNAAFATDTLALRVGKFVDYDVGHITDMHIVLINLSG